MLRSFGVFRQPASALTAATATFPSATVVLPAAETPETESGSGVWPVHHQCRGPAKVQRARLPDPDPRRPHAHHPPRPFLAATSQGRGGRGNQGRHEINPPTSGRNARPLEEAPSVVSKRLFGWGMRHGRPRRGKKKKK